MIKKLAFDGFAIIGEDIHRLVKIKENEDWSNYAWRVHEKDDLYWVPIPNQKREEYQLKDECENCKRRRVNWLYRNQH